MSQDRLIIIDGSSYFFRAYYAIPRLSNSKGFPTNAILGFINMLLKVLDVEKPTNLLIAFDTGKPTFRKEKFQEYKANRESPPDDLKVQIPHILRAVDCFGVKRLHVEGFEADDVIATVSKVAQEKGFLVDIITGDKDLMQLVNDKVTLYDTMKDKRIDPKGVFERFKVTPDQVVDLLGLMGDSSDNIPGVTGIGEKTAADLISQFGSLEGIYERIDEIKQAKRKETLLREKDTAFLSRELATVRYDVPLPFPWEEMKYHGPRLNELQPFLEEMEFQNLLKRFDLKTTAEKTNFGKIDYKAIRQLPDLKALADRLQKAEVIAVDTETTSLSVHDARLVGISLCADEGTSFYIPVGHHVPGDPDALEAGQLSVDTVKEFLKPVLENPNIPKVGQNLKYDVQILRKWGVELGGVAADTLLESYLLDPEQPHNLDSLAFRLLGHQNITYEDVTGKGKMQVSFAEVPIEKATQYAAEDADVTLRLHHKMSVEIEKQNLASLFREVEVPLVQVLADMEYDGILVDKPKLEAMSTVLESEMGRVEKEIYRLAEEPFNINSPKQLSKILFEKLKLPIIRKTKTGISTDESVLMALCDKHPICEHIVRFRELGKIKSTYVDGLLAQINQNTLRVHTNYNQTVTATGRLSSSNPNLQNIPIAQDEKYDVRSVFVAPKGSVLLSADYSQVELRLLASMSEDAELMRAFKNDEDVHAYTGKLIFGTDQISSDQRRIAKTINFGVVYGQTPYGLSQTLKISPSEAKAFIETYFERYKGVQRFLRSLVVSAQEKGYVSTLLGRRRFIPDINASNRMRREMAERAAINAPLQGTAADMIKKAMVSLHHRLHSEKLKSRMVLQVHDELVLEVPEGELSVAKALVIEEMEGALKLKVPLKVDTGVGPNWRACD